MYPKRPRRRVKHTSFRGSASFQEEGKHFIALDSFSEVNIFFHDYIFLNFFIRTEVLVYAPTARTSGTRERARIR